MIVRLQVKLFNLAALLVLRVSSKLNANIPILEGTCITNLKVGVGHITDTSEPGGIGSSVLAAHRSQT